MSANGERLELRDWLRVASVGLRARPLRAALSALGIAIGTAAIVGVLGLSSSSQAGLLAEIDRLGTNLLTVEAGRSFSGGEAKLPREAPARITHLDNVELVTHTALMKGEKVYRNPMIPVGNTGGGGQLHQPTHFVLAGGPAGVPSHNGQDRVMADLGRQADGFGQRPDRHVRTLERLEAPHEEQELGVRQVQTCPGFILRHRGRLLGFRWGRNRRLISLHGLGQCAGQRRASAVPNVSADPPRPITDV